MANRYDEHVDSQTRSTFRGGMGNLDAKQALKYAENMKGQQSEEETDADIRGQRSREPIFRTKSYEDIIKKIQENIRLWKNLKN